MARDPRSPPRGVDCKGQASAPLWQEVDMECVCHLSSLPTALSFLYPAHAAHRRSNYKLQPVFYSLELATEIYTWGSAAGSGFPASLENWRVWQVGPALLPTGSVWSLDRTCAALQRATLPPGDSLALAGGWGVTSGGGGGRGWVRTLV